MVYSYDRILLSLEKCVYKRVFNDMRKCLLHHYIEWETQDIKLYSFFSILVFRIFIEKVLEISTLRY